MARTCSASGLLTPTTCAAPTSSGSARWPCSTRAASHSPRCATRGSPSTRRYAIAPRLADARWFVPRENTGVTAAVLGGYAPYRLSARLKKAVAQAALRMRFARWHSDEFLSPRGPFPPLNGCSRSRLLGKRKPGLLNRNARPLAQAGGHVVNLKGRVLGYAKLGVDRCCRAPRAPGGGLLGSLAAQTRGRQTTCPSCSSRERSSKVFRRSSWTRSMAARPAQGRRPSGPVPNGSPGPELPARHGQRDVPQRRPALSRRGQRTAAAGTRGAGGGETGPGRSTLPSTIMHGDFAPWNVRVWGDHLRAFD